jgi:hypothetical protein
LKTKFVIALITAVALGVLATGVVLAHTPTPTPSYPIGPYELNEGYYGWVHGCYGYNRPFTYQYRPVPVPDSDSTQQPQTPLPPQEPVPPTDPGYYYPPQYPNQGYYPRNYRRGCMGW